LYFLSLCLRRSQGLINEHIYQRHIHIQWIPVREYNCDGRQAEALRMEAASTAAASTKAIAAAAAEADRAGQELAQRLGRLTHSVAGLQGSSEGLAERMSRLEQATLGAGEQATALHDLGQRLARVERQASQQVRCMAASMEVHGLCSG
jgi:uncharacterized protein YukE